MKDIIYLPIIKTGEAEMRGVENLSGNTKDHIVPMFELTRSRKTKKMREGDIYKRLEKINEIYGNRPFVLDLTGESNLSNEQIENLHNNSDGYRNWVDFMSSLKKTFPKIIPTIQISDEGVGSLEEFYDKIKKQVKSLSSHFEKIAYRFPIEYEHFEEDIAVICNEIPSKTVLCVIDVRSIPKDKTSVYSERAIEILKKIKGRSFGKIVLAGSSFPQNPIEYGDDEKGDFPLEEYLLYRKVKEKNVMVTYGDYASICPVRSLQAGGNGWVPRIDLPSEEKMMYRRSRKEESEISYAEAYTRVAELIVDTKRFNAVKKLIGSCWGIEQIELAANGNPPGLSPSYWISVRMNIHMTIRRKLSSNA